MNKEKRIEQLKIIQDGNLETEKLINQEEREIATNILNELDGILAIRATSILKFCIKSIQYNKFNY